MFPVTERTMFTERFEPDKPPRILFLCQACGKPLIESRGAWRLIQVHECVESGLRFEIPTEIVTMRDSDMKSTRTARESCVASCDGKHQLSLVF